MLITERMQGKEKANAIHRRAGGIARKALEEAGVPVPEDLPTPTTGVNQLKRELARQQKIEEEDRLGPFGLLTTTDRT